MLTSLTLVRPTRTLVVFLALQRFIYNGFAVGATK
jgi:hypothetical protein